MRRKEKKKKRLTTNMKMSTPGRGCSVVLSVAAFLVNVFLGFGVYVYISTCFSSFEFKYLQRM